MGRNDRNSRPRTKISEESRVYLDGFLRTNPFFFKNPCLRHGFFFPKIDRAEEDLYIFPVNFHPASERAGQKQNLVRNLSSARLDGVFAAVAARVRGEGVARRDGTAAGVIQKLEINLLATGTGTAHARRRRPCAARPCFEGAPARGAAGSEEAWAAGGVGASNRGRAQGYTTAQVMRVCACLPGRASCCAAAFRPCARMRACEMRKWVCAHG